VRAGKRVALVEPKGAAHLRKKPARQLQSSQCAPVVRTIDEAEVKGLLALVERISTQRASGGWTAGCA
jgi:hypothetical protein